MRAVLLMTSIVLLCGLAAAAGIDLVTGDPVADAIEIPLPAGDTRDGDILWDLTHGVYLQYLPSGNFSSLTAVLAGEGYTTSTTSSGIVNEDLSQYDVVVVFVTSAWYSAYTAEEVDSLVAYVDQGGGLLIAGANSNCPNGNINPVSQAFGTTCGGYSSEPQDLYFSDFISHDIFEGITTIYYRYTGQLTVTPPSMEAAWSPTYSEVMIGLVTPEPRVAVLGTCTGFSNNYYAQADNMAFSVNLFNWLAGEVSLEPTTWAG